MSKCFIAASFNLHWLDLSTYDLSPCLIGVQTLPPRYAVTFSIVTTFSNRVVNTTNDLPDNIANAPFVNSFKNRLKNIGMGSLPSSNQRATNPATLPENTVKTVKKRPL